MNESAYTPFPDGSALRIVVDPPSETPNPLENRIAERWARLRAANPRLFNGPILAVAEIDAPANLVRVRRDEYRNVATQPEVPTGVRQLGVTAVVEARDEAGRRHVLVGRRSAGTGAYGGMWEFGPSGGVDVPPMGRSGMDAGDVWRMLLREMREEAGLSPGSDPAAPIGVLEDPDGRSVELIVPVEPGGGVERLRGEATAGADGGWEYDEVLWVAFEELPGFAAEEELIPSSRALLHAFGWA